MDNTMQDSINYLYDPTGTKIVAVDFQGTTHELSDHDYSLIPTQIDSETSIHDLTVNVRSTLEEMTDSYKDNSILVDIEATRFGYFNNNRYFYLASGGKKSVDTWVKPYYKPYLVNHDTMSEPRGRVVGAKYVSTGKETGYHSLDVKVGHKDEIEMILDSRSLTVSVGSRALDNVECSICGHDLHHNGQGKASYKLNGPIDTTWLDSPAPGFYGEMGVSNRQFWNYKEDKKKKEYTCSCRHIRNLDAPMGGSKFEKTGWYMHQQNYHEVSRVNVPADYNEATGEFAHIRGLLKQNDALSADSELHDQLIMDALSSVPGPTQKARFSVVSEKDLYTPNSALEAMDFATQLGMNGAFDKSQWLAVQTQLGPDASIEAVGKKYYEDGGRFIATMYNTDKHTATSLSIKQALELPNANDFGNWLRQQKNLSIAEKNTLDQLYLRKLLSKINA